MPLQDLAGEPLIEPVRRRQLLDQESGERGIIMRRVRSREAGPHRPQRLDRRSGDVGEPHGYVPGRDTHTRRPAHGGTGAAGPGPTGQPPARISATGRGSPLVTTRACPRPSRQRSNAASNASTALVTYVVSISAAPEPTSGSLPRRARSTIRAINWLSPGPHTRCGRMATTASSPQSAPRATCSASALLRAYGPRAVAASAGSAPRPTSELPE